MTVTVREASEKYKVASNTITRAIRSGSLGAVAVSGGVGRPKYLVQDYEFIEWNESRRNGKRSEQSTEIKSREITRCTLPIGTKVNFLCHEEAGDVLKKGTIKAISKHLVIIESESGYRVCFTHYDYHRGEIKTI